MNNAQNLTLWVVLSVPVCLWAAVPYVRRMWVTFVWQSQLTHDHWTCCSSMSRLWQHQRPVILYYWAILCITRRWYSRLLSFLWSTALTNFGLVTPYGVEYLGWHSFGQWHAAQRTQAITKTTICLFSVRSRGIRRKISVTRYIWKFHICPYLVQGRC